MFSTSCHYGLQAMLYIAIHYHEGKSVELSTIAIKQDIPKHFLSKILQLLVKQKLLTSMKGPTGGFKLARPPEKIRLIEVVKAIDGLEIFNQCGIGLKKCNDDNPCPIHHDYKKIRDRIRQLFEQETLQGLSEDVKEGNSIINFDTSIEVKY